MTTIQQIKSIISPVRVLKVEDWMKVSEIHIKSIYFPNYTTWYRKMPHDRENEIKTHCINLISSFESLLTQPLTKEMFVCDVEKPKPEDGLTRAARTNQEIDYQAALKKIWFEGFEIDELDDLDGVKLNEFSIWFSEMRIWFNDSDDVFIGESPTVSDLIYHISKFNETASKPVEINVTDSFIQELIK